MIKSVVVVSRIKRDGILLSFDIDVYFMKFAVPVEVENEVITACIEKSKVKFGPNGWYNFKGDVYRVGDEQ